MWQILEHRRDKRPAIQSITHTCARNISWGFSFTVIVIFIFRVAGQKLCCNLVPSIHPYMHTSSIYFKVGIESIEILKCRFCFVLLMMILKMNWLRGLVYVDEWMVGWLDEWMMEGWMNGWWKDGCLDGCVCAMYQFILDFFFKSQICCSDKRKMASENEHGLLYNSTWRSRLDSIDIQPIIAEKEKNPPAVATTVKTLTDLCGLNVGGPHLTVDLTADIPPPPQTCLHPGTHTIPSSKLRNEARHSHTSHAPPRYQLPVCL